MSELVESVYLLDFLSQVKMHLVSFTLKKYCSESTFSSIYLGCYLFVIVIIDNHLYFITDDSVLTSSHTWGIIFRHFYKPVLAKTLWKREGNCRMFCLFVKLCFPWRVPNYYFKLFQTSTKTPSDIAPHPFVPSVHIFMIIFLTGLKLDYPMIL